MSEELFSRVEALMRSWRLEEATQLLEGARIGNTSNRLNHDLSVLYAQQGFHREALAQIEAALARDPQHRALWHHFLAIRKNDPVQPSAQEWRAMHLGFGDTLRERFDARHLGVGRSRDPGARLRIGYLSPDTHNATQRFVWPVMEHFERAVFDVFAYWSQPAVAAQAPTKFPDVAHRSISGLDDEALAQAILSDRIDILVDVAGHGAGNALTVLALRPAPVQMTWLDYLATTGLDTVDYRIADAVADPPGAEASHVEALIRLPVPQWCYRPPAEAPAIERRPEGPITFGSVCVPLKLSEPLLDVWARLMLRVPDSRLRLLGIPEGRARTRIMDRMTRVGVDSARLELRGRLPLAGFFREVGAMDVVLDSFPFSGATATMDALWMGTPVVTLPGALSHSRSTASILTALGHGDWVAASEADYIELAASLAANSAARDRGQLREGLRSSVLCDGRRFAREMEGLYRKAWSIWVSDGERAVSPEARSNALADAWLRRPDPGPQGPAVVSTRARALLRALPSHRETAAAFWREFREVHPPPRTGTRLDTLGADWVLVADPSFHAPPPPDALVPTHLLDRYDILGPFGADALPRGDPMAAGRGHVSGVLAFARQGEDRVYGDAWIPEEMGPCVVLPGPVLLVRRSWIEGRTRPWEGAASELEYRYALAAYTLRSHREGARLGVCVELAAIDRTTRIDLAAEWRAQLDLVANEGVSRWSQRWVAASPVRAAFPLGGWQSSLSRFGRYCDSA